MSAHSAQKAILEKFKHLDALPSVFLFYGPEGVGKRTYALELIRHRLETTKESPPDLRIIAPEGKGHLITIEKAKQVISFAQQAPYEAKEKWLLIDDADRLHPAAANALLKTLEEPLETTHFILITSHPKALLPTIRSRAQGLLFGPLSDEFVASHLSASPSRDLIATAADGSLGRAQKMGELIELMPHIGDLLTQDDVSKKESAAAKIETLFEKAGGTPKHLEALLSLMATFYSEDPSSREQLGEQFEQVRSGISRHIKLRHLLFDLILP